MERRKKKCMNGGRPKIQSAQKKRAIKLYKSDRLTVTEICRRCEISRTTLYRFVNEEYAKENID